MQRFKCGFAAIVGKPNVGKSTILNYLLQSKLAIVSDKPETTRDNIRGIVTTKKAQVIFIDTPGIHRPHLLLAKSMVKKAQSSLFQADLLLFTVDLTDGLDSEDFITIDLIKEVSKPTIALINKIDRISKGYILPLIEEMKDYYHFLDIIPISAVKGDNMDLLKEKILEYLPEGDMCYPADQTTDKDERFQAAEAIREKVLLLTREEVPHSVAVAVDRFVRPPSKDIVEIEAIIYVERDSQKGIIIGQKGAMVKEISVLSRRELEAIFKKRVSLRIWVKVLKNWRKDPNSLRMLNI